MRTRGRWSWDRPSPEAVASDRHGREHPAGPSAVLNRQPTAPWAPRGFVRGRSLSISDSAIAPGAHRRSPTGAPARARTAAPVAVAVALVALVGLAPPALATPVGGARSVTVAPPLNQALQLAGGAARSVAVAPPRNQPLQIAGGAARYVALGDSVAYGHGLANPGRRSHDGLGPDQGPSSAAWPSLVAAGLAGLAPLALRPTGCTLTRSGRLPYDQLAVSGAPMVDSRWTGADGDCPVHAGRPGSTHRAVAPDEIVAADLAADPPALVTIQAGADDIDFAGCLEALLGVPAMLGGAECVTGDGPGRALTARADAELAGLAQGLRSAVDTIHGSAPRARILLVDYYQPIPAATAVLSGRSLVCSELRLRSTRWRSGVRSRADLVARRLDDTIRSVALAYPDVRLVSVSALFAGHEMCTRTPWVFSETWDAAHPTAAGQRRIAAAVLAACSQVPRRCVGR